MSPVLGALGVGARAFGMTAPSGAATSFDLLTTNILTSTQTSITIDTSSYSTYKDLQLRMTVRTNYASNWDSIYVRYNGDTGSNYSSHGFGTSGSLYGETSSGVDKTYFAGGAIAANNNTTNVFTTVVVDLVDAFNTNKYKVHMVTWGAKGTEVRTGIGSGRWGSTSAITSIVMALNSGQSFVSGSRFSLYGIKG